MFGLEKFFKKQKEPVNIYVPHMEETNPEVIHIQQVLEDGKLYSTEKAEKMFKYDKRVYFITPKKNMFSAGYRQYVTTCMKEGSPKMFIDKVEYTNLRIEEKIIVKMIIGKVDIELYKKYFEEPEEA